jgi:hypothetical protein
MINLMHGLYDEWDSLSSLHSCWSALLNLIDTCICYNCHCIVRTNSSAHVRVFVGELRILRDGQAR